MQLARFLTKLFKEGGLVLIDANSKKYVIGNPKKENSLTLKLLDKSLHYKLLFYPDLYFGEAYSNGSLTIDNGNLTEFLEFASINTNPPFLKSLVKNFASCIILTDMSSYHFTFRNKT